METVVKQRRSVAKRQKRQAEKEARKTGDTQASLTNVPSSDRKMRLVADLVRGKRVGEALAILKFQSKQGSEKIEKLLLTAIADWQAKNPNQSLEEADLVLREIFVNGGRMLKRLRPAPQGRGYRVRKRSNHITMVVAALNAPAVQEKEVVVAEEVVETKAKKTTKKAAASDAEAKTEKKTKAKAKA